MGRARLRLSFSVGLAAFGPGPTLAAVTTYCCDAAAESAYLTDLASAAVVLLTPHEGFDAAPWGTATDLFSGGAPSLSVSNLGITWVPLPSTINGALATSTAAGGVHDGTHLMYAVDSSAISHPDPDGFSISVANADLYGVGGWFRGTGSPAKLAFFVDGSPTPVDFTGAEATVDAWKFLGFVDDAPFRGVEIRTSDEAGNELRYFFADDFTFGRTESLTNLPPVADAGLPQTVMVGDTVVLDGSASRDADGDPITYEWSFSTKPLGSLALLDTLDPVYPSFIIDQAGSYVAQLIVHDGTVNSLPDLVDITGGCSGDAVVLENTTIPSGVTTCAGTLSIALGPNLQVLPAGELDLRAPVVSLLNGVTVHSGAALVAGLGP